MLLRGTKFLQGMVCAFFLLCAISEALAEMIGIPAKFYWTDGIQNTEFVSRGVRDELGKIRNFFSHGKKKNFCYHLFLAPQVVRCTTSRYEVELLSHLLISHNFFPMIEGAIDFIVDASIASSTINNLCGGRLQGTIQFVQSHLMAFNKEPAIDIPRLMPNRDALLLFSPQTRSSSSYLLKLYRYGYFLGQAYMFPPRMQVDQASDQPIPYSLKAWSLPLPAQYVGPGLSIELCDTLHHCGELPAYKIHYAAPNEQTLLGLQLGILTNNENEFIWVDNAAVAAVNFYQTFPVTTLHVGFYQPVTVSEVLLSGVPTYYNNMSSMPGHVGSGDLRKDIAESIYATGIQLANIGFIDSVAGERWQPQHINQVILSSVVGHYINGNVTHGYGSNDSIVMFRGDGSGSELSRGVGYSYGLFDRGLQHSSWGYHHMMNMLTSPLSDNVDPQISSHSWAPDVMAGGDYLGRIAYAYPAYSDAHACVMQRGLTKRAMLSMESSTGYMGWEDETQQLLDLDVEWPIPVQVGVPVVTIVGQLDPTAENSSLLSSIIYPPLFGNYGHLFKLAEPDQESDHWCALEVHYWDAGPVTSIGLGTKKYNELAYYNKFHINVDYHRRPSEIFLKCVKDGVVLQSRSLALLDNYPDLPKAIHIGGQYGYDDYKKTLLSMVDDQLAITYKLGGESYLNHDILHKIIQLGDLIESLSDEARVVLENHRSIVKSVEKLRDFLLSAEVSQGLSNGYLPVYIQLRGLLTDLGWSFPVINEVMLYTQAGETKICMQYSNEQQLLAVDCNDIDENLSLRSSWFLDPLGLIHSYYDPSLCITAAHPLKLQDCRIDDDLQTWRVDSSKIVRMADSSAAIGIDSSSFTVMPQGVSWGHLPIVGDPYWSYLPIEALRVLALIRVSLYQ